MKTLLGISALIFSLSVAYFAFVYTPGSEKRSRYKQAVQECNKFYREQFKQINEAMLNAEAQLNFTERWNSQTMREERKKCPVATMEKWGY